MMKKIELDEGEEYCPICGRLNFPGACDVCRHHIGLLWEGEIINCVNEVEECLAAWGEAAELRDELESFASQNNFKLVCDKAKVTADLKKVVDWNHYSASTAIQGLLDFKSGNHIRTSGMLGGSGCNLYLPKPKITLKKITREFQRLSMAIRARIEELEDKH